MEKNAIDRQVFLSYEGERHEIVVRQINEKGENEELIRAPADKFVIRIRGTEFDNAPGAATGGPDKEFSALLEKKSSRHLANFPTIPKKVETPKKNKSKLLKKPTNRKR
jgi:hypothetical protein